MDHFDAMPERIFLDSSTLQTVQDYGEYVWEGIEPLPTNRTHRIPGHFEELRALRAIFLVNERAQFEFALSGHSLDEVAAKGDRSYLQWAYDVLDHWNACLADHDADAFDGTGAAKARMLDAPTFGYLSRKDHLLIQDALTLECDAFLTMETRLPKNAEHIRRHTGLLILRPSQLWERIRPWSRLFL